MIEIDLVNNANPIEMVAGEPKSLHCDLHSTIASHKSRSEIKFVQSIYI